MKLTILDINTYKEITNTIDILVKLYFDKFICEEDYTYRLERWKILDNNNIRIVYTYEDYFGYDEYASEDVTFDKLNKIQG